MHKGTCGNPFSHGKFVIFLHHSLAASVHEAINKQYVKRPSDSIVKALLGFESCQLALFFCLAGLSVVCP